jgi:hypothetical protein
MGDTFRQNLLATDYDYGIYSQLNEDYSYTPKNLHPKNRRSSNSRSKKFRPHFLYFHGINYRNQSPKKSRFSVLGIGKYLKRSLKRSKIL